MKILIGFLIFVSLTFADTQKLVIDANNFETNDVKGISVFTGNVKLKMGKDKLNSDKLEIFVEPKKKSKSKPLNYTATGNVNFEIFSNTKHYKGKGDKIIYDPKKEEYTVIGNGYLKEITEEKELFGEKIFINQVTGNAKVTGTKKKPVRIIINIESDDK